MTAATQTVQIQPPSPSRGFTLSPAQSALSVEVAKCLKLVAPSSMTADAQLSWIASAVDALEDIRAAEVQAISAEIRRSVTRPAQIVPEIAKLVHERRKRASSDPAPDLRRKEMLIDMETGERRGKAKNSEEVQAAWEWERQARRDAGLSVPPRQKPLSRKELDELPGNLVALGIKNGFLERRDGKLFETV